MCQTCNWFMDSNIVIQYTHLTFTTIARLLLTNELKAKLLRGKSKLWHGIFWPRKGKAVEKKNWQYLWKLESLEDRRNPYFRETVFALHSHFLNWAWGWRGDSSHGCSWPRRGGSAPASGCSDPRAGAGRARWHGWGASGSRCWTSRGSPHCCASPSAAGASCWALTSSESGP